MKFVFNFLEKIYWAGFGVTVFASVFVFALLAWLMQFVRQQTGSTEGVFATMSDYAFKNNDTIAQFIFSPSGFSRFVLIFVLAVALSYLHAKTFSKLRKFMDAKLEHRSLTEQRAFLWPVPKYIVMIYALDFFLVINKLPNDSTPKLDEKTPQWARQASTFIDVAFPKLLPSLGSPLGLILALVIFFYCQSLEQTESLSLETRKLKEEAELII